MSRRLPVPGGAVVAAAGAGVMVVALLALKWYGYAGSPGAIAPRIASQPADTGWSALTLVRWLVLLTAVLSLATLPLAARRHGSHRLRGTVARAVLASGALTALMLIVRVFVALPGDGRFADQKLGAVLAVLGSLAVCGGGLDLLLRTGHGSGQGSGRFASLTRAL